MISSLHGCILDPGYSSYLLGNSPLILWLYCVECVVISSWFCGYTLFILDQDILHILHVLRVNDCFLRAVLISSLCFNRRFLQCIFVLEQGFILVKKKLDLFSVWSMGVKRVHKHTSINYDTRPHAKPPLENSIKIYIDLFKCILIYEKST